MTIYEQLKEIEGKRRIKRSFEGWRTCGMGSEKNTATLKSSTPKQSLT